MWSRCWQWACHVDHIPEPGDYFVCDVGPHSALILQQRVRDHVGWWPED